MRLPPNVKAALVASTALSSLSIAAAQDSSDGDVEEIITVAGRREQNINQIAKSVSVLSEQVLEQRQYTYMVDALQSLPGVTINQNGSFGGSASVSIRGASSDQTVILIDGVQMNDPASPGGGFNFANMDPSGIERVEVLRGPQSVLYGSDAIGGVINIITKAGQEGFGGNGYAEYGAFDSFRLGGDVRGGTERIGFNLSASYVDTDGISAADSADGNPETDGFQNLTLRGKVSVRASDSVSFDLISSYVDSEDEFDGSVLRADGTFGLADTADVGDTKEFMIAGRSHFALFDGRISNTVSVELTTIDRENFRHGASTFTAEGERFNLDYLGVLDITDDLALTAGAQHENIDVKSDENDAIHINSVFGLLTYTGIDGLTISGGLRLDDHENFGSTTNGEVNAAYIVPGAGTKIAASWSEGFKAPTIFQLTFACCGFEPNPNLNPERAQAWEVGITQPLLDGRINIGATYFNQDIEDLIEFTFTAGYQNIAEAKLKGIELLFDAEISDTLSLQANYTYTDAENGITGDRLVRRPENMAFAALTWQPIERLSTTVAVTHNGSELDSGSTVVDSWTRVDLRASYQLTDTVEFYGRVDNLFDEEYQQILGYGTPGISAFGGLRVRF